MRDEQRRVRGEKPKDIRREHGRIGRLENAGRQLAAPFGTCADDNGEGGVQRVHDRNIRLKTVHEDTDPAVERHARDFACLFVSSLFRTGSSSLLREALVFVWRRSTTVTDHRVPSLHPADSNSSNDNYLLIFLYRRLLR